MDGARKPTPQRKRLKGIDRDGSRKLTPRDRLIQIAAMLKEQQPLNSAFYRRHLRGSHCSPISDKTFQRAIEELRTCFGAPIDWDARKQVYRLTNPGWILPLVDLMTDDRETALFTSLFCTGLAAPYLAGTLRAGVEQITSIEVAVGLPGEISRDLLQSLVLATTSRPALDGNVFDAVNEGWRRTVCLDIDYRSANGSRGRRIVEPHVLYLSNGAWYIHAWCRAARDWRNFALHRIDAVQVLEDQGFERKQEVVDRVRRGDVFQFPHVEGVRLRAAPAIAARIREREWFPGQSVTDDGQGGLFLAYARVTKPFLLHWVMAHEGEIVILEPASLRGEFVALCERLAAQHR